MYALVLDIELHGEMDSTPAATPVVRGLETRPVLIRMSCHDSHGAADTSDSQGPRPGAR